MSEYTSFVIGIYCSQLHIHNILEEKLSVFSENYGIGVKCIHYFSLKELLVQEERLDCLLLDIYLPGEDGTGAVEKLLERGVLYKIIILSDKEIFKECFKINAFRFLTKPADYEELYKALCDVYMCSLGMEKVIVYKSGIPYNIRQMDIIFIMANRSSTIIYTMNNEYRSEYTLVHWEKVLDKRVFFRCHKSYIVNISTIKKIENTYAVIDTDDKVMVSRRRKKELVVKYSSYNIKHNI